MFVRDVVADFDFLLQRQLFARSERVKGIDVHPHEPWIPTTLYSGMNHPSIWTCQFRLSAFRLLLIAH